MDRAFFKAAFRAAVVVAARASAGRAAKSRPQLGTCAALLATLTEYVHTSLVGPGR